MSSELVMRKPKYLSPSALMVWLTDPKAYYLQYLTPVAPSRFAQTLPMACGSAFDAYIKSYFHNKLYGNDHPDSEKFGLRKLFEDQVEEAQRTEAWTAGAYLFNAYLRSGAAADLMLAMGTAPQFEFSVEKVVGGVPLLGKPDVHFKTPLGVDVIFDFKVNGYCGKYPTSPMKGYVRLLNQLGTSLGSHKNAIIQRIHGLDVNVATFLEANDEKWAMQLATYGWLMGAEVGSQMIVGVHQLACDGANRVMDYPSVRVAVHCCRISSGFQHQALANYQKLWSLIHSSPFHFFQDVPLADSQAICDGLDGVGVGSQHPVSQIAAIYDWCR